MEIEIFNETNEDLEKELSELKELLMNVSKDEGLDNILFNVISLKNPSVAKITVKNINIPHKIQLIKIKL